MPGPSPRALLVLATVVSLVGLVDAVVSRTWDFAVVFALALALQLLLLLRVQTGRVPVTVRRDLAGWASEQAVATGETTEEVVDRCLAAVRANVVDHRER
jgi:NAD/NADP transhydrogenase beta subunit